MSTAQPSVYRSCGLIPPGLTITDGFKYIGINNNIQKYA
jgi:hypothetical protein